MTPKRSFNKMDADKEFVYRERRARPPIPIEPQTVCQHYVFRQADDRTNIDNQEVVCLRICKLLELEITSQDNQHIIACNEIMTLKWEQHTEFIAYTLFLKWHDLCSKNYPWEQIDLPWDEVKGIEIVSLLIYVMPSAAFSKFSNLTDLKIKKETLCKSTVMSGNAEIWSDFYLQVDGNSQMIILTESNEFYRLGRLVQRLLEVETYSTMCVLAQKTVIAVSPELEEAELKLQTLITRLPDNCYADEQILFELYDLSIFEEASFAKSYFRLNASLAYYTIVERRLEELRETRIEGHQRFSNFILRRLSPLAKTYRSILRRQEEIGKRTSRATQLLRSRTDVQAEKQNQKILSTMNERAEAQYKLQKTVEGLSAIAITYYSLGILSYLMYALSEKVNNLDVKLLLGILAPLLFGITCLIVRKARKY